MSAAAQADLKRRSAKVSLLELQLQTAQTARCTRSWVSPGTRMRSCVVRHGRTRAPDMSLCCSGFVRLTMHCQALT